MKAYRICPHCGAHLDAGEQCDCDIISEQLKNYWVQQVNQANEQLTFKLETECKDFTWNGLKPSTKGSEFE